MTFDTCGLTVDEATLHDNKNKSNEQVTWSQFFLTLVIKFMIINVDIY